MVEAEAPAAKAAMEVTAAAVHLVARVPMDLVDPVGPTVATEAPVVTVGMAEIFA